MAPVWYQQFENHCVQGLHNISLHIITISDEAKSRSMYILKEDSDGLKFINPL